MLLKSLPKWDQEKCDASGRSLTGPIKKSEAEAKHDEIYCDMVSGGSCNRCQDVGCEEVFSSNIHVFFMVLLGHTQFELRGFQLQ